MRWLKLFIAIAALVTTIGCWDRREVEELAIVTTMGLDLSSNGDIEMTVEIVMPQGKKEQQGGGFSQKGKDKVGQPYVISAKGVRSAMQFPGCSLLCRAICSGVKWKHWSSAKHWHEKDSANTLII